MATTCAISCNINSSQALELDSSHQGLLEPRTNEFSYELDVDASESVKFEIDDFVSGGTSYSVVVSAVRDGGGSPETWSHNGEGSVSPVETGEVDLSITVTATPASGPAVTGGGVIRIQPKGKPD